MNERIKFLFLALLLATVSQGAWAQSGWDDVYAKTQTTQANWTQLNAGSSSGQTLGATSTTTYYYTNSNLSFTNSNAGGSGLTILGTVYLYVPSGVTLTCTGANASGATGGGAGIELTAGNSLYLIGGGTINATGGKAANGGNGGNGDDAYLISNNTILGGSGGAGGNGGGGAGAGIGTRGANGGSGGSGGQRTGSTGQETTQHGVDGNAGSAGGTAAAMGAIYVFNPSVTLNATAGSAGSNGTGGSRGKTASQHPGSNVYMASGGGGGGAGGFGGAASNIGTGGPGGGGGGGGAAGNVAWVVYSGTLNGYYHAGAYGGKGGQNTNGSYAPNGADVELDNPKHADIQGDGLRDKDTDYTDDAGWENGNGRHNGGSGAACGNASTSGSTSTVTFDWTTQEDDWGVICLQTGTTRADWVHLTDNATTGKTLGAAGTTTYYYTAYNRTFTNSNAGGGGLTILGTVYLYIPSGKQITCTGANASGTTGGGAGIELTAGNKLYLIGSGRLVATGGNAANGGNGGNGGNASYKYHDFNRSGDGGNGGAGGGGAGAGIGTRGGNGGAGGVGGAGIQNYHSETTGNAGSNGQNGGTAAAMGTLYIYDGSQALTPQTDIHGGNQGPSGGNGGAGGLHAMEYDWTMGGGAGGAGGGFGGAASDIGTGGPGGGGGGGGASGSIQSKSDPYTFYQVGALGGNPGVNGDGTNAGSGASTLMENLDNVCQIDISVAATYIKSAGWQNGDNRASGGSGGNRGSASQSSTANNVTAGWPTQGAGTEDAPFIIGSTNDWKSFANTVNGGYTFNGQFLRLNADIEVSTMAGADDANSFQGTFDGYGHKLTFTNGTSESPFGEEYCAPLRHVKNAVIKNLHVDGTIYTSVKKAAGIVGESHGALTLTGCRSSVAINSSKDGDGSHGGLVSTLSGADNTILIEGCVFDGSFATTNNTIGCGGFIAWPVYNRPTITNSLMKPGSVAAGMLGSTFCRVYYEPTIANCYYVAADNLPANQGKKAFAFASDPGDMGNLVQDYGLLKAYALGILFDGNYYVEGTSITLNEATIFGESKYVTSFYSGTKDYQMLEDAKAYTMSLDGGKVVFHQIGDDGSVIPHGTAVVIVSSESSVNLRILNSTDVAAHAGNILQGSDSDVTVTEGKVEGKTPYVLSIDNSTLGFYKFNGSTIPAGKAYYLK